MNNKEMKEGRNEIDGSLTVKTKKNKNKKAQ